MAKSTATCNSMLSLVFNGTNWANIADNTATSPLTSLYLGLHTATVGTNDAQTTNETAYTNYARVAVSRTSGGWTVSTNTAKNTALVQFAQCGASGATLTDVSVGTAASGTGHVLYTGALNSSLAVSNGIQPQFAALALTITET